MCERLLNLQEIYVSGQNICIEVYGNSVGTMTPSDLLISFSENNGNPDLTRHHQYLKGSFSVIAPVRK